MAINLLSLIFLEPNTLKILFLFTSRSFFDFFIFVFLIWWSMTREIDIIISFIIFIIYRLFVTIIIVLIVAFSTINRIWATVTTSFYNIFTIFWAINKKDAGIFIFNFIYFIFNCTFLLINCEKTNKLGSVEIFSYNRHFISSNKQIKR